MTAAYRIKVVSWNLLHRSGATVTEIEHLVARERPDLLLMQEATEAFDSLPSRIGGHYARSPLPGRRHGLAAWSSTPFGQTPVALTLQDGMIVRRICQIIALGPIGIANVHLSHGQLLNRRQLRRIAGILPAAAAIVGDCNMVGSPLLPGFHDVGPRHPTHSAATLLPLRLDRCFVRGLTCDAARLLPAGGSDHLPISVRLTLPHITASSRSL